jgi:PPOX class probable F420-dependent enzyme
MLDAAVREFLNKPLIARVSTNGADGFPHTAPVWFIMDGDDVVVISERDTRKVKNLAQDSRAAVQVGGEPGDAYAVLFRGSFSVTDDVNNAMTNRITYHYEEKALAEQHIAEWADFDMVTLRMTPEKVTVSKL